MSKRRTPQIKRFRSFGLDEAAGNYGYHETLKMEDDKLYSLTVYPGNFEFTLKYPDGSIVSDSFRGLKSRAILYKFLENGAVYKWIRKVENSILLKNDKLDILNIEIPLGFGRYQVSIDRKTGKGWLLMPEYTRSFKLEDIFLQMPDIPMLNDGSFLTALRGELIKCDIELPKTPYYPMLKLTPKEDS